MSSISPFIVPIIKCFPSSVSSFSSDNHDSSETHSDYKRKHTYINVLRSLRDVRVRVDINIAVWSQFTVAKGGNNLLSTSGHRRKENYRGATFSTAKTTHALVKVHFIKGD